MSDRDSHSSWKVIVDETSRSLTPTDDICLWQVVIAEVFRDAQYLCNHSKSKSPIFTEIGSCSQWQRPHQQRWLKNGGFAAPYGYGGDSFNIHALPEFDWSARFRWSGCDGSWTEIEKINGKRPLTLRVTLPTRTITHNQAAVHTIWTPGSPTVPHQEAIRLYGFRKSGEKWQCTATEGDESPYESTGSKV